MKFSSNFQIFTQLFLFIGVLVLFEDKLNEKPHWIIWSSGVYGVGATGIDNIPFYDAKKTRLTTWKLFRNPYI